MKTTRTSFALNHLAWALGLALVSALALATLAWVPPAAAGVPCCAITAIQPDPADPVGGIVSARETATGRTFQFKVSAKLLKGLKVGQAIYADFKTMKVSLNPDGAAPCCEIRNLKAPAGPLIK